MATSISMWVRTRPFKTDKAREQSLGLTARTRVVKLRISSGNFRTEARNPVTPCEYMPAQKALPTDGSLLNRQLHLGSCQSDEDTSSKDQKLRAAGSFGFRRSVG